jgi:uncharacterized protein YoxC
MTTLETLMAIVMIIGIINVTFIIMVLRKLYKINKVMEDTKKILDENKSNMDKVTILLDVLMKRTSRSNSINLN